MALIVWAYVSPAVPYKNGLCVRHETIVACDIPWHTTKKTWHYIYSGYISLQKGLLTNNKKRKHSIYTGQSENPV